MLPYAQCVCLHRLFVLYHKGGETGGKGGGAPGLPRAEPCKHKRSASMRMFCIWDLRKGPLPTLYLETSEMEANSIISL